MGDRKILPDEDVIVDLPEALTVNDMRMYMLRLAVEKHISDPYFNLIFNCLTLVMNIMKRSFYDIEKYTAIGAMASSLYLMLDDSKEKNDDLRRVLTLLKGVVNVSYKFANPRSGPGKKDRKWNGKNPMLLGSYNHDILKEFGMVPGDEL